MNKPHPAYADHIGDTVFFLICVAIAAAVTYAVVIVFQPELWRLL